jgi:hypothetical protein
MTVGKNGATEKPGIFLKNSDYEIDDVRYCKKLSKSGRLIGCI